MLSNTCTGESTESLLGLRI